MTAAAAKLRAVLTAHDPDPADLLQIGSEFGLDGAETRALVYKTVLHLNLALFPPVTELELIHTEGCNLACTYCFEREMLGYRTLPTEIALAGVDVLCDYSGSAEKLSITHFGGEPTLNFPGVCAATEYAETTCRERGKSVSFHMTSNGSLLNTEMAEYFAEHAIQVLLSIDGLAESHDRYRIDKNGRGTFESAIRALRLLKRTQRWVGAKVTVMPANASRLYEDVTGLHNLGINQFLIGPATGIPWTTDAMKRYAEQLAKVKSWYLSRKNPDLRISDFDAEDQGPHFGCQAGRNNITLSVTGEISSCAKVLALNNKRLVGKLGDVWLGLTHIRNRHEYVSCRTVRQHCDEENMSATYSGGCFASNFEDTGDLFTPSKRGHQFTIIQRAACSGCSASGSGV